MSCEIETCYKFITNIAHMIGSIRFRHWRFVGNASHGNIAMQCKILHLLFNLLVTILQCCNLQETCKPWKNFKALNLLWSITTTQHKKNTTKRHQIHKRKEQKNGLPLNNQITQHCTSWGNNRALDWDSIFWATAFIPPNQFEYGHLFMTLSKRKSLWNTTPHSLFPKLT